MEDSVGIIFATIIAVIIVFLFPMLDVWERQDDLSYMLTYSRVVEFVDTARNTGYISQSTYDALFDSLAATGNFYDIEIEHRHYSYVNNGVDKVEKVGVSYYTTQIEEALRADANHRYNLAKDDYIYVSVKNTNKTAATVMKQFLYNTQLQEFKIGVPYGGMVRNEPTL